MNNDQIHKNGIRLAQAMKVNQSISQEEEDVTYQQQAKWVVNGSGITQKELLPSPTPPEQNLWDPKYSALGFVVIVLAVLMIDVLPRLIRSKLDQATTPEPVELNELQSILVAQLDSLSSDAS